MFINPPKNYIKLTEDDNPQEMGYDFLEFKYPGEWCVLHSNGRTCKLESKERVIKSDRCNYKFDLVGHYWKFRKKYRFTYFDVITIDGENFTESSLLERRKAFAPYVRNNQIPRWVFPSSPTKISKWNQLWRYKVLSPHMGVSFPGLVFKKKSSKYGDDWAVLNKTI